MENLAQDVRYALRSLRRAPGFAALVVLTLALGIGANAAIFSVVDAMMLASLPYRDTDTLVRIWDAKPAQGWTDASISAANFEDWQRRSRSFEDMAIHQGRSFNLTLADQPLRVRGERISANLFGVLGREPLLGRDFSAEEGEADAPVALLSHELWTLSYGQDPNVVGSEIRLDGVPHTIIGVMPPEVDYPGDTQIWVPSSFHEARDRRGNHSFEALGRLAEDVGIAAASAEMAQIAADLEREYPEVNAGWTVRLVPLTQDLLGDELPLISATLMLAVGFVLLIACVNTASLLLARAVSRQKEVALRVALGASRRRLLGQLLTESLLLALLAGALGVGVAQLGARALVAIAPADAPRMDHVAIDGTVLAFTLAISLASGLLFGLAPALQSSRPDLNEALADSGRTTLGHSRHRLLRGLVSAEVALALALLALGLLMVRSFDGLLRADPGFDTSDLLTARLTLPESKYPDDQANIAFFRRLLEELGDLPGVEAATAVHTLPLGRSNSWRTFTIEGKPLPDPNVRQSAGYLIVEPDYFEALDVPILAGRALGVEDLERADTVVVNQTMAERYWPELADPIGQRLRFGRPPAQEGEQPWLTVVGMAADVKHQELAGPPRPEIYVPYSSQPTRAMTLVLETRGDPASLTDELRKIVLSLDPDQPLYDVRPMTAVVDEQSATQRALAQVLGTLALGALALAGVGIYGVLAFSVGQRRHEIGIRRAMGAQRRDIVRFTLILATAPVAIGAFAGAALAVGLGQAVRSIIVGVSPGDPSTYLAALAVIALTALAAALVPAKRAADLDPLSVLRHE